MKRKVGFLLILFILLFLPFVSGYSTKGTVQFYQDISQGVVGRLQASGMNITLPSLSQSPPNVGIGDIHKNLDFYMGKTVTTRGTMGFSLPLIPNPVWDKMADTQYGIAVLESADGYSIFIAKPLPSPCPNLNHLGSIYQLTGEVVLIDGKLAIRCSSIELIP